MERIVKEQKEMRYDIVNERDAMMLRLKKMMVNEIKAADTKWSNSMRQATESSQTKITIYTTTRLQEFNANFDTFAEKKSCLGGFMDRVDWHISGTDPSETSNSGDMLMPVVYAIGKLGCAIYPTPNIDTRSIRKLV